MACHRLDRPVGPANAGLVAWWTSADQSDRRKEQASSFLLNFFISFLRTSGCLPNITRAAPPPPVDLEQVCLKITAVSCDRALY